MSFHIKKCPYCGHSEFKNGLPKKKLGSPTKRCNWCGREYLDSNYVDWDNASFFGKLSYALANGRGAACLFAYLLCAGNLISSFGDLHFLLILLLCLPVYLIAVGLCWLIVSWEADDKGYNKKPSDNHYYKYKNDLFTHKEEDEKYTLADYIDEEDE